MSKRFIIYAVIILTVFVSSFVGFWGILFGILAYEFIAYRFLKPSKETTT